MEGHSWKSCYDMSVPLSDNGDGDVIVIKFAIKIHLVKVVSSVEKQNLFLSLWTSNC